MKRKGRTMLLHAGALLFMGLPVLASAATLPSQIVPSSCNGTDCTCQDLVTLASNVLNAAIYLAVFLAGILFMWAGFNLLAYANNPSKRNDAKKMLQNVAIGFVGIIGAWLIVNTLLTELTSSATFKVTWNAICG